MIVADREGTILQAEPMSQEQKEQAIVMIFRSFCNANPDMLKMGGRMQQEQAHTPE